jgi:hypothetical protein
MGLPRKEFRHVPGLDILVPHPPGTEADGYLLNVFAARPRRAAQLEAAGLLAADPLSPASATTLLLFVSAVLLASFAQHMPIVLPVVGAVLIFLLAFIAVAMA